jgi:hypothetical protein
LGLHTSLTPTMIGTPERVIDVCVVCKINL